MGTRKGAYSPNKRRLIGTVHKHGAFFVERQE
nr:MAG TPA: hypothetical protein [Caudoviricetes sp.]